MTGSRRDLGGLLASLGNAWRRRRRGLPARGGGAVSPEAPNDAYVGHLAVYQWAGRFASGRQVLDLGCGTGYGAGCLRRAGAAAVVGLDPDTAAIAYAARRFAGDGVRFVRGRHQDMPAVLPAGSAPFDLVVAANLLAHLAEPAAAVTAAARLLRPDGALVASVPPIADERTMDQHRAAGLHRANHYLWDWELMLGACFAEVRLFGLRPPAGASLDLADPRPSRLAAADFDAEELRPADLGRAGHLAALLLATSPRAAV